MTSLPAVIKLELLSLGGSLWSSVNCVRRRDRVIVYTALRAGHRSSSAFSDAERVLRTVLTRRLAADWVAVVLCGDRVSYTVRPRSADLVPFRPPSSPEL